MKRTAQLVFILILASCGNSTQEVSEKAHAEQLLNERDYDAAIPFLEDMTNKYPGDSEFKVLLASAYTGSVGLNIVDAFGAFKPLLQKSKDKKNASLRLTTESADDPSVSVIENLEKKALKLLDRLTNSFEVINGVPYTPAPDRARLIQALLVLKEIPSEDGRFLQARNYSAILNLLQFLNHLRDSVDGFTTEDSWTPMRFICQFEMRNFLGNIEKTSAYLVSSADDLTTVYQRKEKEIPAAFAQIRESADVVVDFYRSHKAQIDASDVTYSIPTSAMCR